MNKPLNILFICLLSLCVSLLESDTAAIIDSSQITSGFWLVHNDNLLALLLASSRPLTILHLTLRAVLAASDLVFQAASKAIAEVEPDPAADQQEQDDNDGDSGASRPAFLYFLILLC